MFIKQIYFLGFFCNMITYIYNIYNEFIIINVSIQQNQVHFLIIMLVLDSERRE